MVGYDCSGIARTVSEVQIRYAARIRWNRCTDIASKARLMGLKASPEMVNRRYDVWCRWDEGRLATGYLMRMTGVRRIG